MDGYITCNGKVNWFRFNHLLKKVSAQMELKMIKTTADDMHLYLNNIETGKFSDLIPIQDEDEDYKKIKNNNDNKANQISSVFSSKDQTIKE